MIPHNKPTLGREEEKAAIRVLRAGFLAQGKEVEKFEDEFCDFLSLPARHAVAVSSGTAALFLALWAFEAKNKRVAFPVYACAALRHAAAMAGAKEVLIDTTDDSPNIDLESLQRTAADISIIPHMFGLPVDFTDVRNMVIIEDCAQALGAKINGIPVGLHGRTGVYSFYATKLITSGGQGGMVVSKDKAIINAIRDYREYDQRNDKKIRFNLQMTDLQAAIGRAQLKKLPFFLQVRKTIYDAYINAGLNILDVARPKKAGLLPVRYRAILAGLSPRRVIKALASKSVRAIVPIESWELLAKKKNAFRLTKNTVSLPLYPSLKEKDIKLIISVLQNI